MLRRFVFLLAFALFAVPVAAQVDVTPDLGATVPGSWVTDRFDPSTFALSGVPIHGRADVLQLGVTSAGDAANRPSGQQSTFYNTQGRKIDVMTPGSWVYALDLFIEDTWQDPGNGYIRTDIWATATGDPAFTSITAYPILGFTNYGSSIGFRGYDVNTGAWMNFSNSVNYGAWNTLAMALDVATNTFTYLVNGVAAGSVIGGYPTTGVRDVMVQAYNYNDPALGISGNPDYLVYWSNSAIPTETVPEPMTMSLLATGLVALGGGSIRRRKKPDNTQ